MKTSLAMLIAGLVAAGAWIALEPGMHAPPPPAAAAAAAQSAGPAAATSSATGPVDAKRTPDRVPGSGPRID